MDVKPIIAQLDTVKSMIRGGRPEAAEVVIDGIIEQLQFSDKPTGGSNHSIHDWPGPSESQSERFGR